MVLQGPAATDSEECIGESTTSPDYAAVRAAIFTDVVTDASLEDSVIAGPLFHPMAELDVYNRIPKLQEVITKADFLGTRIRLDDYVDAETGETVQGIATLAEYDIEKKLKLQAAVITRTAYRLMPRVRQLKGFQAGEEREDYEKVDWEDLTDALLAESDGYINEVNDIDPGSLSVPTTFRVFKAQ